MTSPGVFPVDETRRMPMGDSSEIERTLGEALRDFASELRLTDAADLVAFIRIGQMENVRSIALSSAELYFKSGTLDLAEPGELFLGWFTPPLITLPMTFSCSGVRIYFRLRLAALSAGVEVESINAGQRHGADLLTALREALQDARLSPPQSASSGHS